MIYVYLWKVKDHSVVNVYGIRRDDNRLVKLTLPLDEPENHLTPTAATRGYVDEYSGNLLTETSEIEDILKTYNSLCLFFIRQNVNRYTGWKQTKNRGFESSAVVEEESAAAPEPVFNLLFYKIFSVGGYPYLLDGEIEMVAFHRCQYNGIFVPAVGENRYLVLINGHRRSNNGQTFNRDEEATTTTGSNGRFVVCNDEKELLNRALQIFSDESVHFLIGYNNASMDDRYLARKLWKYELHTTLSEFQYPYHQQNQFYSLHFTSHQLNLDIVQYLKKFLNCKYSTLMDVYRTTGMMKETVSGKYVVEQHLDRMVEVCSHFDLLKTALTISSVCFQSAEQVILAGTSKLLEPFILIEGFRQGYLVRRRQQQQTSKKNFVTMDTYRGGRVLLKDPGPYPNVGVVDFKGYYPSLISSLNLSPSSSTFAVNNNGSGPGLFPRLCTLLTERRNTTKNPVLVRIYKLLNNSIYGLIGSPNSKFYHRATAEAITAAGRRYLDLAIDYCETTLDLRVVAADTDSLFISGVNESRTLVSIAGRLTEFISVPSLELAAEYVLSQVVFLNKKRYFGLTLEGSLVVRGIFRRDFSLHSNRTLKDFIAALLRENNVEDLILKFLYRFFDFNLSFRHSELSILKIPKYESNDLFSVFARENNIWLPPRVADLPFSFVFLETSPLLPSVSSLWPVPEILLDDEEDNEPASLVEHTKLPAILFDQVLRAMLGPEKYDCNVFQTVHQTLTKFRFVVYELKCMFFGLAVDLEEDKRRASNEQPILRHHRRRPVPNITEYLNKRFGK